MGKILKFFREIGLDFTPQPGEGQWGGDLKFIELVGGGYQLRKNGGDATQKGWGALYSLGGYFNQ